jgi:YHS domain-containing protein
MGYPHAGAALCVNWSDGKNFMAQNGTMESQSVLKDPVCGMTVTHKSFHHLEHQGQSYFFCGTKCKTRFAARLDQYTSPSPAQAPLQDQAPAPWLLGAKPGRLLLAAVLLMALVSLGLWLM